MLMLTVGVIVGIVVAAVLVILIFLGVYFLKKDKSESLSVYVSPGIRNGSTTDLQQRIHCYPRGWGYSACYDA